METCRISKDLYEDARMGDNHPFFVPVLLERYFFEVFTDKVFLSEFDAEKMGIPKEGVLFGDDELHYSYVNGHKIEGRFEHESRIDKCFDDLLVVPLSEVNELIPDSKEVNSDKLYKESYKIIPF